ncbi:hypothetical protein [Rathayibacter sp. AY1A3]|uniref:hypothetical protein n=1 Tax=Rathayibacter sp. AY1A3 TaxID=2080521 RepID=UPI000CE83EF3|nr:hypothetical protein [Rathayibacter sp. AY1A3]PPF34378.1 hypothetical protein C5C10_09230 [Rathayibacter sp. AY1A3]
MIPALTIEHLLISTGVVILVKDFALRIEQGDRVVVLGQAEQHRALAQALLGGLPAAYVVLGSVTVLGNRVAIGRGTRPSEVAGLPGAGLPLLEQRSLGDQLTQTRHRHGARAGGRSTDSAEQLLHSLGTHDPDSLLQAGAGEVSVEDGVRLQVAVSLARRPKLVIVDLAAVPAGQRLRDDVLSALSGYSERANASIVFLADEPINVVFPHHLVAIEPRDDAGDT